MGKRTWFFFLDWLYFPSVDISGALGVDFMGFANLAREAKVSFQLVFFDKVSCVAGAAIHR